MTSITKIASQEKPPPDRSRSSKVITRVKAFDRFLLAHAKGTDRMSVSSPGRKQLMRWLGSSRPFCSTCQLLQERPRNPGQPSRSSYEEATWKNGSRSLGRLGRGSRSDTQSQHPPVMVRAGRKAFLDGIGGTSAGRVKSGAGAVTNESPAVARDEGLNRSSSRPHSRRPLPQIYRGERRGISPGQAPARPDSFDDTKVHFIGIDLETALPKIFASKLPVYRSPSGLFNLRAYPSSFLPARRPPPFPMERNVEFRRTRLCVYTSVITSKAVVSKLAVERNRCRRRFKAALETVVNGSEYTGGRSREGRMALVTPEFAYVASLTAELHDAPHAQLVSDILDGLRFLQHAQPRKWDDKARLPEVRYISRGLPERDTVLDRRP